MKESTCITIRRFTREDLDAIVQINRRALPENYPPDFFLYCFKACPEGFLVAEADDGKIIGYIMLRVETAMSGFRFIKKGHIVSVAVRSEYRRRGTGTRLIKSALAILSEKGINEFYLEVRESNTPALNMYERLDFKKVKLQKRYYQDGESAYRMVVKVPKD